MVSKHFFLQLFDYIINSIPIMKFCNFLFLWHREGIRIRSYLYLPSLSERCCDGAQVQLQSSVEMVERPGSHNNMYSARYRVIASTILPPRLLCYGYRTIVKFSLYRTSIWLIDWLFVLLFYVIAAVFQSHNGDIYSKKRYWIYRFTINWPCFWTRVLPVSGCCVFPFSTLSL